MYLSICLVQNYAYILRCDLALYFVLQPVIF